MIMVRVMNLKKNPKSSKVKQKMDKKNVQK
jgi:hypothetical protein